MTFQVKTLELDRGDGYAIVRLNRPPVNAINTLMVRELRETFSQLSLDRSVSAVILSSKDHRIFSAGIDLKEKTGHVTPDVEPDVRAIIDPQWEWRQAQYAIRECLVPVIAAVEGKAIGAGLGLLGVCDLVIAGDNATFGLTEINVGLLGGASKIIRTLGPSKARRMLFFGEMVPASEFYRLGGVEELVPSGTAEERACELAAQLAGKSPIALRLAKESILRIEGDQLMQQYRTENDYTYRLRSFNDSREAMLAFVEKRDPVWSWS